MEELNYETQKKVGKKDNDHANYKNIQLSPTLKIRKTLRAKLVDLSTFWAVPGSPLLKNFDPYCIARHILSLASALFKYRTTRASSALATSEVLILFCQCFCIIKATAY